MNKREANEKENILRRLKHYVDDLLRQQFINTHTKSRMRP